MRHFGGNKKRGRQQVDFLRNLSAGGLSCNISGITYRYFRCRPDLDLHWALLHPDQTVVASFIRLSNRNHLIPGCIPCDMSHSRAFAVKSSGALQISQMHLYTMAQNNVSSLGQDKPLLRKYRSIICRSRLNNASFRSCTNCVISVIPYTPFISQAAPDHLGRKGQVCHVDGPFA